MGFIVDEPKNWDRVAPVTAGRVGRLPGRRHLSQPNLLGTKGCKWGARIANVCSSKRLAASMPPQSRVRLFNPC
jgi:hypothetical protein